MPKQIEDYVHRIGRTARAGCTGSSHAFFAKKDAAMAFPLIKLLEKAG